MSLGMSAAVPARTVETLQGEREVPLDEIDVFTPDLYLPGVPYESFRRLRAEDPVHFHRERGGPGFWAITRHHDIVAISRDPHTFSSYRKATFLQDYDENSDELTAMRLMLLNMDPPQHSKFRNLVRHSFIPKMVAYLEPSIRQRVRDIFDRLPASGEVDLVPDVAQQLPVEVIAEMIGVPAEDRQMIFDLSTRCVTSIEPTDDPRVAELREEGRLCAMQMWQYAGELAQQRYERPANDLISLLMHGVVDGENITPMEFATFFMLLVVAGYETTRNLITTGTLALLRHPEQHRLLLDDPSLIPSAVEEMLRWEAPIIYFRRTVTRDVELRGKRLREGDKLALFYPSANRDEELFTDGHRFDVRRAPNEHLAFGTGEHACLGMGLARLEIRIMFEELLRRFPRMELCGEPRRFRSSFVNGLETLPVRLSK